MTGPSIATKTVRSKYEMAIRNSITTDSYQLVNHSSFSLMGLNLYTLQLTLAKWIFVL